MTDQPQGEDAHRARSLGESRPTAAVQLAHSVFGSRYMPCPDCGASLEHDQHDRHSCERERWLDYQTFQLRKEVDLFATELSAYLASPAGLFELWYAERERRPGRPKGDRS